MLLRTIACLAIGALMLIAGLGCVKESALTVTIREDGTATVTHSVTADRQMIEQQLRLADTMDGGDEESAATDEDEEEEFAEFDEPEGATKEKEDVKAGDEAPPDTGEAAGPDARLAAKIRALIEQSTVELDPDEGTFTIDAVEVGDETVRIQTTYQFKTLEAFARYGVRSFSGLPVERVLLDTDENGKLRLTLSSSRASSRGEWTEFVISTLEEAGYKGTFTFTMPGKIVSSTLPTVAENTTSIALDTATPEATGVLRELLAKDIVIVAEPGALVLEGLPLDSNVLAARGPNLEGTATASLGTDLPITDAEGAYMAEPLGVTTTLVHVFPEGEKELKDRLLEHLETTASTCQVQAELYAPEGRIISEVSDIRITRAVDDQGREVKPIELASDRYPGYVQRSFRSSDDEGNTFTFIVELELPAHGAATIETVEGELVATTFAKWKEHEFPNPQTDPKKELDIGDLVPGAKLYIGRIRTGDDENGPSQGGISLKITGPPRIQSIQAEVSVGDEERMQSYESSSSTTTQGEQVTRKLTVSYFAYSSDGEDNEPKAITLVLKVPDDLKRERVKFLLEAIDLF